MLNDEYILTALGGVSDSLIEEAGAAMKYGPAKERTHAPWRTLLIAAVIVSLLGITAYAAGWFGLSSRLTQVSFGDGEERAVMSMNAYSGTPEAEAHAKWQEFCREYTAGRSFSNDGRFVDSLGEPEKSYAQIYGAFDRTMLDKLAALSDSFGIRLHEHCASAGGYDAALKALGITDFIRGEAGRSIMYFYEDGSFKSESSLDEDGQELRFTLIRGAKGALDPSALYVRDGEAYDEWQYETDSGITVNIALDRWNELTDTVPVLVFCDTEDYIVTVAGECRNLEDIRESAESFAGRFDYAALSGGETDPAAFAAPAPSEPSAVKPKAGLMSVRDFFDTDEYKASAQFRRAYSEAQDAKDTGEFVRGMYEYRYFGAFPASDGEINEILRGVTEKYPALAVPGEADALLCGCPAEAERITGANSIRSGGAFPSLVYENATADELTKLLGVKPFCEELRGGEAEVTAVKYDTGAFACALRSGWLYYIPKGTLFPLLRSVDGVGEAWAYESLCGEQVSIALGSEMEYPLLRYDYVLYETETAYVFMELEGGSGAAEIEKTVDSVDFTVFGSVEPWSAAERITPRYRYYAPLTIMKETWYSAEQFMIAQRGREYRFFTYAALSGQDAGGIVWTVAGSDNVTLTDNGDGTCTLVYGGTGPEAVRLTAGRGGESFTVVVECRNAA